MAAFFMLLKNISGEKSRLFAYLRFRAFCAFGWLCLCAFCAFSAFCAFCASKIFS